MAHSPLLFVRASAAVLASCGKQAEPGPGNPGNPGNPGGPGNPGNPPDPGTPNPGMPNPGSPMPVPKPGQTSFTTEEATSGASRGGADGGAAATPGAAPAPATPPPSGGLPTDMTAPAGRVADVEEGDIYKVDHNRLFYLNTYRGFVIYDVSD